VSEGKALPLRTTGSEKPGPARETVMNRIEYRKVGGIPAAGYRFFIVHRGFFGKSGSSNKVFFPIDVSDLR